MKPAFAYPEEATPLDPDEAAGLRLTHITLRSELDRWEQEGIIAAELKFSRSKPKDILTDRFAIQLHKMMFGSVWRWAGTYRTSMKNIGIDAWRVGPALKDLLDDVRTWIEFDVYPADEIAARLHHRLVLIHCFPNGNGRHARLLADIVLVHLLNRPRFTWGGENLVTADKCRSRYIAALRAADGGDYEPLLAFVRS